MMTRNSVIALLAACAMGVVACPALGQPEKEEPSAPLGGPPVKANRPPMLEDSFTSGRPDRGMGQRALPLREMQQIFESMRGEAAPEKIRLSKEQDEKIRGIWEEYRRQQRGPAGDRRPGAGRPGGSRPERPGAERPQRPEMPMEGERPREDQRRRGERPMMDGPARPQDALTRVWAVLNKDQQEHVTLKMEEIRKEMAERRDQEMLKRRMEERRNAGGDERPGAGPAGDEAGRGYERIRKIAERMRDLSPQDRERIFKMIESELDKAEKSEG